jgi:hypothetical protein
MKDVKKLKHFSQYSCGFRENFETFHVMVFSYVNDSHSNYSGFCLKYERKRERGDIETMTNFCNSQIKE